MSAETGNCHDASMSPRIKDLSVKSEIMNILSAFRWIQNYGTCSACFRFRFR